MTGSAGPVDEAGPGGPDKESRPTSGPADECPPGGPDDASPSDESPGDGSPDDGSTGDGSTGDGSPGDESPDRESPDDESTDDEDEAAARRFREDLEIREEVVPAGTDPVPPGATHEDDDGELRRRRFTIG